MPKRSRRTFSLRLVLVAYAFLSLLGGRLEAREYFVDAVSGKDRGACISHPDRGTFACRSISYVVDRANLRAGDRVHIGAGRYRERISLGPDDSGDKGAPVVFLGEGDAVIEGLDPVDLDDAAAVPCTAQANCNGNGAAYPHVYRLSARGRSIEGVVETSWSPIRVDDSPVTGVVFDLTRPIPARGLDDVADVELISGSYMVRGDALFVHPYKDVAPSVAGTNLETIKFSTVVELQGAHHIRLEHLTIRYASQQILLLTQSSDIELKDLTVYSASGTGILINNGSARIKVRNVDVSHVWGRKNFSRANKEGRCFSAECGWHNNAGGTGFKIDGGAAGAAGFDVRGLTAYNAWNVVSIEQVKNSTFVDVLAKNSPNHTFIMFDKVKSPNCRDNLLRGVLAFNGQDSIYIAGCQNSRSLRSAFNHWFQGKTDVNSPSTGWRVRGTLGRGMALAAESQPGFSTDYNLMGGGEEYCKIAYPQPKGSVRFACDAGAWKQFGYDAHSRHSGVKLAGFSRWPAQNGLELSRKTREDFYPLAGSSTIDAGDPDLDGDGTLETGPGGDDECIPAHDCKGAGPDIGPFEYGIVQAK